MKRTTNKALLLLMAAIGMLTSCQSEADKNELDITDKFNMRWNLSETLTHNDDGSITFHAVEWGGMAANFATPQGGVNWTEYDRIIFEFAEPTTTYTQIVVNETALVGGKRGISKIEGSFLGRDVSDVRQVCLQSDSVATINVKRVYLIKASYVWNSTTIWEGTRNFGNWTDSLTIAPEKFATASPGDILEFVITTDNSDPNVTYWQVKTVYWNTDKTLEGNDNELNDWGCANVGQGRSNYHITLTARDVQKLQDNGLFINGFFTTVNKINLLQ